MSQRTGQFAAGSPLSIYGEGSISGLQGNLFMIIIYPVSRFGAVFCKIYVVKTTKEVAKVANGNKPYYLSNDFDYLHNNLIILFAE